jgi:hypothetical protein
VRKVFAKIVLFLSSFALIVCFLEMILRFFPSSSDALIVDLVWNELPAQLYQPMPQHIKPNEKPKPASFRHKENSSGLFRALEYEVLVETNSIGFRGPDMDSKPQILLLGDSFVFGGQVVEQKIFASLLQQNNPNYTILNAGVDGYGTQQSINLWQFHEKNLTSLTQVVLFFFWGNDIGDNVAYLEGGVIKEQQVSLLPLWPAKYSRIYGRMYLVLMEDDSRIVEKRNQNIILNDSDRLHTSLQSTKVALNRFNQYCISKRVECSMVLIPPVEAFEDIEMTSQVIEQIYSVIPTEIETIDLFSDLMNAGGGKLYFTYDPHWNAAGHKVVSEQLQIHLFE